MPDVLIDLRRPASDGVDVGTVGAVECVPTSRREVDGAIVLPSPFAARLVDGAVTVDLAETGLDWCWRITERVRDGITRYVTVPASVVTLDYVDLVDVDPDTLDPWEPGLSAAYDAALALKLNTADLDTAATALDANAASALRVQQDARLSSTYVAALPDTLVTRDASGRIAAITENGITTTYTRDALGRVTTITRGAVTRTVTRTPAGQIEEIA